MDLIAEKGLAVETLKSGFGNDISLGVELIVSANSKTTTRLCNTHGEDLTQSALQVRRARSGAFFLIGWYWRGLMSSL